MKAREVVIFSDEPGWHGRSLRRRLGDLDVEARFVSLSDCHFDLSRADPHLEIPGFNALPEGAFVRGIAGGSLEQVVLRLDILHALEAIGVPVFNTGRAIERTVDKGLTSFLLRHAGIPTPPTWVMESIADAGAIIKRELGAKRSVVVKPLFGSQGNGVIRIRTLQEFEQCEPTAGVYYLQQYVDSGASEFCDWRVFVVRGRAVAAMRRRSLHWVTNRAQGAICEPVQADRTMYAMAEDAARVVAVDYAGVDLLRDRHGQWMVGEVNGIPAWQGLQRATATNISEILATEFVAKMNRQQALAITA